MRWQGRRKRLPVHLELSSTARLVSSVGERISAHGKRGLPSHLAPSAAVAATSLSPKCVGYSEWRPAHTAPRGIMMWGSADAGPRVRPSVHTGTSTVRRRGEAREQQHGREHSAQVRGGSGLQHGARTERIEHWFHQERCLLRHSGADGVGKEMVLALARLLGSKQ